MPDRFSRLMPFNVYDIDWRRKCFSIVYELRDVETRKMAEMRINDPIFAVQGPFGVAYEPPKKSTVVFVGEEIGLASLVGLCRAAKTAGNKAIGIAGFSARRTSLLENQMRLNCNKFYVMYKDGMHERRGDVLGPLTKILAEEQVVQIHADATADMLKDIYYLAWSNKIPLKINVMGLMEERSVFFETSSVLLKDGRYFPTTDGVFVDAARIDVHDMASEARGLKGYRECRRNEAALSAQRSVFARFKKFIWG